MCEKYGWYRLPLSIPSKAEESHTSADLARRIDIVCNEQKEKRRQEWESHKQALDALKERKKQLKQPNKEENKAVFPDGTGYGGDKRCGPKINE